MVGSLSKQVIESKERVRTALKNCGISLPIGRITVNISPVEQKKDGVNFDLAIAVGLLCNMGILDYKEYKDYIIIGELGLNGDIKSLRGVLPIVNKMRKEGFKKFIIPRQNRNETIIFDDIEVILVDNISDFVEDNLITCRSDDDFVHDTAVFNGKDSMLKKNKIDFSDIIGQENVKRAVMIAVSGWHNMLMTGVPGAGKSMIASRIPTVMPKMSLEEQIEVSSIQSICGLLEEGKLSQERPYCSTHHTISIPALIGGGNSPQPGKVTIAHKGVLFLDELPEFYPNVIDSLRQPLEEKIVRINRLCGSFVFPADFLLIAAMNPCKCGYYPDRNKCNCSIPDIKKYLSKVSGPILDRIDLNVEISRTKLDNSIYNNDNIYLDSRTMKARIINTINIQRNRQGNVLNSNLSNKEIRKYCKLDKESDEFLKRAYENLNLSMRGYFKIIKVARTIADLEEKEDINIEHIKEALGYRVSDIR